MPQSSVAAFIFATALVSSSAAARGIEIIVEPQGRYLLEEVAADPGVVYFLDEKPSMFVRVSYVSQMNAPKADASKTFAFATRDWLDSVQFRVINRADGAPVPAVRSIASRTRVAEEATQRDSGGHFILRDRQTVQGRVEFEGIPPGDYEIEASIPVVAETARPARFTVRRGDEDLPTIKLHYRYRADNASGDFRAFERILRELMTKYEPDNAGILVQIADWSVDKVSAEETVRLYREARAMLEAKLRADAASDSTGRHQSEAVRETIEQLALFERVLPYYRDHKNEVRFGSTFVGGKRVYGWFPRRGGPMIAAIDLANPAGPPVHEPR